jgi:hypothetical protein
MVSRLVVAPVLAAFSLTVVACGGSAPQPESEAPAAQSAPAADASHAEHPAGARVFFMQPTDGATVKSPVQFVFGSEQITIAAVPPGEVTTVREGIGHFHLGVDTDCLPAGTVIPKADPWIHFGDGKNTIEMQLKPGPHKFAVQAGDDKHATIAGLCETISITVTE